MVSAILNTNALSNKGMVRSNNEDSYIYSNEQGASTSSGLGTLLMVADGMGGAEAGEKASNIAVNTVKNNFVSLPEREYHDVEITDLLRKFILDAHRNIIEDGRRNPNRQGMGTTAIVAWLYDGKAFIGWSGDSRCYLFRRDGQFELVTRDHSHVWEQYLAGGYDPDLAERARLDDHSNIITQCLGDEERDPRPEVEFRQLQEGDRLILCSDGLNSMISDDAIRQIVTNPTLNSTKLICDSLVRAANAAGGQDNVTVIVSEVVKFVQLQPSAYVRRHTPDTKETGGGRPHKEPMLTNQQRTLTFLVFIAALVAGGLFLVDYLRSPGTNDIGQSNSPLPSDTSTRIINQHKTDSAPALDDGELSEKNAERRSSEIVSKNLSPENSRPSIPKPVQPEATTPTKTKEPSNQTKPLPASPSNDNVSLEEEAEFQESLKKIPPDCLKDFKDGGKGDCPQIQEMLKKPNWEAKLKLYQPPKPKLQEKPNKNKN